LLRRDLCAGQADLGGLAASPPGGIVIRKAAGPRAPLPAVDPLESLLQLGQHAALAQLEQVVARGATLERISVDLALVVDQDDVPFRRLPLHRIEAREALAQPVELSLDGLLGNLGLLAADLEALVLPQLGPRPDG